MDALLFSIGNTDDIPDDTINESELINANKSTEEEKLMQCQDLPFKILGNIVIDQAKAVIEKENMFDKDEYYVNDRCAHKFMEMLQNLYLPTFPVWSNITLGNLLRHCTLYHNIHISKTLDTHRINSRAEQYFRLLKDIA